VDLYFVGTKLFLAYVDTMFGTDAARGEDPLRWVLRVTTIGGTKECEKGFGILGSIVTV
jgi:hypothetical protein